MLKIAIGFASLLFLASCATAPHISPVARSDLAPTGKLRVGTNFGNVLLATKDPVSGDARGIAVDLARELGRRVGVPVELVGYDSAGKMAGSEDRCLGRRIPRGRTSAGGRNHFHCGLSGDRNYLSGAGGIDAAHCLGCGPRGSAYRCFDQQCL
jgi:hypothetical protein